VIITRLFGGLGNQLFQYAAGRAIAIRLGVELRLDITKFASYTLHRYSLGPFRAPKRIATVREIGRARGEGYGLVVRVRRLLTRIPALERRSTRDLPGYLRGTSALFDPRLLDAPDGAYLEGSWQSERYFSDVREVVLRDFEVATPSGGQDAAVAAEIGAHGSISLHVRRCDYVADPARNLSTCDEGYYSRAIEYLKDRVENPRLFVFSDDPGWVRANMRFGLPMTYVAHNGPDRNYEDLRLMSLCRHNVVANSSFSWWGAWLNRNPGKIVIAPREWFPGETPGSNDVRPASWTCL
jgi:hypothetical protein